MSEYTTQLRYICESEAGLTESKGYGDIASTIEAARAKIFSFDFPIWDEAYRPVLETKILRHYYMREIGMETYGLWKMYLENKLNEIMPYYNELYKTQSLITFPLYTFNYNESLQGSGQTSRTTEQDTTQSGETNSSGTSKETGSGSGETSGTGETTSTGKGTYTSSGETSGTSRGTDTMTDSRTEKKTGTDSRTENKEHDSATDSTGSGTTGTDTTRHESSTAESSGNTTNSNTHTKAFSDTPQSSTEGVDLLKYLTEYTMETDSGSGTSKDNSTNSVDITEGVKGTQSQTAKTTEAGTEKVTDSKEYGEDIIHGGGTSTSSNGNTTEESSESGSSTDNGTENRTEQQTTSTSSTKDVTDSRTGTTSGTAKQSGTEAGTSTNEYIKTVAGFNGKSQSELLMKYRQTLINIDMMVIEELESLFMLIW